MVKAKCFCIFKNEEDILEDWIRYHLAIFGDGNVHLIDDHSTDDSAAILKRYEHRVTVERALVEAANYRGENLSRLMGRYKNACELLIPIEADEFITLQNSADPSAIRAELEQLDPKSFGRFKFHFNYSAIPRADEAADPLLNLHDFQVTCFEFVSGGCYMMNKSFYAAESFVNTDPGNHQGFTLNERTSHTDLWLTTFPIRSRQQLEERVIKEALYKNFWQHTPSDRGQWRQGYEALRAGTLAEYFLFWTNQPPHTRRTFFAEQIEKLRKPASLPSVDAAASCFVELSQLCSGLSDLLCNWVSSRPASHPCFDLPELLDPPWLKLADDTDAVLRYGMLRRYNPARFMQLGESALLPGVSEAIEPTRLRTQPLMPLASAVPTLARTLQPGDFVSLETVTELRTLLPQLPPSTIIELRAPGNSLPPSVEPLFSTSDAKAWELLYSSASLTHLALPRAQWLRVN